MAWKVYYLLCTLVETSLKTRTMERLTYRITARLRCRGKVSFPGTNVTNFRASLSVKGKLMNWSQYLLTTSET